jgi:ketosteroid isomerase-like protein
MAMIVALGVSMVACEAQEADVEEAPADTVDQEAAVNEVPAAYEAAYNAGDAEAVIALYDEDFVEYNPEGTMDYAAVTTALRDTAGIPPGSQLTITTESLTVAEAGDYAFGHGSTSYTATGPDGMPIAGNDRWLGVFRNVDGEWKLHRLALVAAAAMEPAGEEPMDAAPADTAATM